MPAIKLNEIERRVLGTLIEKALTTPQGYPLSLNSLMLGCNQKSARDPMMEATEQMIEEACNKLKQRSLAIQFFPAGGRVPKWEEALTAVLNLNKEQSAIIAELLLRGPQSEGELRQRASRMAPLDSLAKQHEVLESLRTRPEPLVQRLSGEGRTRGVLWAHTFYPEGEEPALPAASVRIASPAASSTTGNSTASVSPAGLEQRLAALEARVAELERKTNS
ncbi:MAG: DUF480 domain-containing protein [Planctomycetes bacterium]|nr:DUF480 domain-containing protein [Planctomycetota bacterium]